MVTFFCCNNHIKLLVVYVVGMSSHLCSHSSVLVPTEQELAMSAGAKVKELKAELATQRTRQQDLEKHYKEKLALKTKEVEALQARMQQSHDQHMHELKAAQSHVQQLEQSTDRNLVQKLTEVRSTLNSRLQM